MFSHEDIAKALEEEKEHRGFTFRHCFGDLTDNQMFLLFSMGYQRGWRDAKNDSDGYDISGDVPRQKLEREEQEAIKAVGDALK